MKKSLAKVLCIGSMGKDIFFPLTPDVIAQSCCTTNTKKQFCFDYGSKVHVNDRFGAPGGCACNVSTGLARLHVPAAALGNIGSDADGQWIVQELKNDDVHVDAIRTVYDTNTDISMILVDTEMGERTIFVNRDVGERLVISQDDLRGYQWCFVGSLYGNAVVDNMRVLHNMIVHNHIKLVYNPGGHNIVTDEMVVLDLIHHAEILFVNKSEAQDIVVKFDCVARVDSLDSEEVLLEILWAHMRSDTSMVIVTDGRRGAWMFDGKEIYHTDTVDKLVHDATGAGDAFASGFLAGVIHECTAQQCMQWGSANSDAVIDYYGAQEGLLKYDIIQTRAQGFDIQKIK